MRSPEPVQNDEESGPWSRRWSYGLVVAPLFAVVFAACSLLGDSSANERVEGAVGAAVPDSSSTPGAAGESPTTSRRASTTSSPASTTEPTPAVSFAADVQPIIEQTCASCHTGSGPGTQHLVLDTAAAVAASSWEIEYVTRTGWMPPWPASDESVDFEHDWSLTDAQIEAIREWDEMGSPLDVDPASVLEPRNGVVGLGDDADAAIRATGTYAGTIGQPDEYRCFVYDPAVAETQYVQSFEFIPEQPEVVHHAIGYQVDPLDRPALDALDALDEQGGWPCSAFGPGSTAQDIFAWAPGQGPTRFEEGAGLVVDPGDFFVLQTHYHFDVAAPPDRSTLAVQWATGTDIVPVTVTAYVGPAEIPCGPDEVGPRCDRNVLVAEALAEGAPVVLADAILGGCGKTLEETAVLVDGIASSSCDQPIASFGKILSVFGHEHELGRSVRLTLNPDTPEEIVLLDIPEWDFAWQLNYEPVDDIVLVPGDVLRIECTWDRNIRDEALEPAYVFWDEGTDDEMCYSSITTRPVEG